MLDSRRTLKWLPMEQWGPVLRKMYPSGHKNRRSQLTAHPHHCGAQSPSLNSPLIRQAPDFLVLMGSAETEPEAQHAATQKARQGDAAGGYISDQFKKRALASHMQWFIHNPTTGQS
jgi:hypothetical protein